MLAHNYGNCDCDLAKCHDFCNSTPEELQKYLKFGSQVFVFEDPAQRLRTVVHVSFSYKRF